MRRITVKEYKEAMHVVANYVNQLHLENIHDVSKALNPLNGICILNVKVIDLQFSVRCMNALKYQYGLNYDELTYVRDIVKQTERQLMKRKNMGRKSINEIKTFLESHNLYLKK